MERLAVLTIKGFIQLPQFLFGFENIMSKKFQVAQEAKEWGAQIIFLLC